MTAGPGGVRDPAPNNSAVSKAVAPGGFAGSPVRPIVISFRSRPSAPTRGSGGSGDNQERNDHVNFTQYLTRFRIFVRITQSDQTVNGRRSGLKIHGS